MTAAGDQAPLDTPFSSHALSDVGRARQGNEDNYFRGRTVFAVADGMGGHSHGEIASDMAVQPLEAIDGRAFASAQEAEQALVEAVRAANDAVVERSNAERELRGMGTTLTVVMVREGRLLVAHVGDSRAYLFRPGEGMSQLTTDHTLVEQLVRDGRLSRDEIATHPQRSVITRAIGVEATVQVDTLPPIALEPGDQVLLCSDGLSGPVDDEEIADLLAGAPDGDSACRTLIAAANRHGGPDNITVVLLRVGEEGGGSATARSADLAAADPTAQLPSDGTVAGAVAGAAVGGAAGAAADGARSRGAVETLDAPAHAAPQAAADLPAPAAPPPGAPASQPAGDGTGGRGRLVAGVRVVLGLLGLVVLVAVAAGVGYLVLSRSHYLGVDGDEVAIFTGTDQEIAGFPLYRVTERTGVQLDELPVRRQQQVRDGVPEPSVQEARATLRRYQDEAADAAPAPSPSPSPTPSPSPAPAPPADPAVPPPADALVPAPA